MQHSQDWVDRLRSAACGHVLPPPAEPVFPSPELHPRPDVLGLASEFNQPLHEHRLAVRDNITFKMSCEATMPGRELPFPQPFQPGNPQLPAIYRIATLCYCCGCCIAKLLEPVQHMASVKSSWTSQAQNGKRTMPPIRMC